MVFVVDQFSIQSCGKKKLPKYFNAESESFVLKKGKTPKTTYSQTGSKKWVNSLRRVVFGQ